MIWDSFGGMLIYVGLKIKYHLWREDASIVIFNEADMEFNHYALIHLNEYMSKKYLNKAVIVTNQKWIMDHIKNYDLKNVFWKYYEKRKFAKIYAFSRYKKFNEISLNYLGENRNIFLLGCNGISKQDIICYCNYNLFSYKERES